VVIVVMVLGQLGWKGACGGGFRASGGEALAFLAVLDSQPGGTGAKERP
jgi:hypothetical protein